MKSRTGHNNMPGALYSFGWALLLASVIFIPLMIYNGGYFVFLGDFNVQQIPFYQHAHEMIRSGNFFWDWQTDLGANFIGSYSFYLLFSPFFWLTLPFPTEFVPHLMAPLLILKTACAALTSYLYIKRFVPDKKWAVMGSVLYAFSGFMTFNIFFNHFHEPCILFPLLLVALEELVENNRRGFFAAMVAVNCLVNYWFFIGEVVFVILYVIVRIGCGGWNCSFGRFCSIAFESVLGVLIAAVGLLPSALALMGNPRTGWETLLTGWNMWIYGWNQRFPAILQSFFFPPELPSRPNFFPDMGAKWSSLSAWLPLFSSVGALAYCRVKKRTFVKRLIVVSMVMALIPILNASFVLFSQSYYARWFYMPILFLCIATVTALSERDIPMMRYSLASSWRYVAVIIVGFVLAIGFSPIKEKEEVRIGLYGDPLGFWLLATAALLCLLLTAILLFAVRSRSFYRVGSLMLSAVIVVFTTGYLCSGKADKATDDAFISTTINGRVDIQNALPDDGIFARSDLYHCGDNLGLFWGLPNIQAFHSIVPASIMEFYPAVGIKRDVSSKPGPEYTSLRPFLSVRWLFIPENDREQSPMPGYSLYDTRLGYNIYENDDFLPMGFSYQSAFDVDGDEWSVLSKDDMIRAMLSSVGLSAEALERNRDILKVEFEDSYSLPPLSEGSYRERIRELRYQKTCDSFAIDSRGFTATCAFPEESLVFFSVPFDQGWSATVNDTPVLIEKANIGFMAVRVPAGNQTIRFTYMTPGLYDGALLSGGAIVILLFYLLLCKLFGIQTRRTLPPAAPEADFAPVDEQEPASGEESPEEPVEDYADWLTIDEPDPKDAQPSAPVAPPTPVIPSAPVAPPIPVIPSAPVAPPIPVTPPPPTIPQPPTPPAPEKAKERAILDYLETLEELPPIDEGKREKRQ